MIYDKVEEYKEYLRKKENKPRTIEQYERNLIEFIGTEDIKNIEDINKDTLIHFKEFLQRAYKVNTVNIKIIVINSFIAFLGLDNSLKLQQLKQQQKATLENVLSEIDYKRLSQMALKRNKIMMYYLMETLVNTGIRISELKYITVEAVKKEVAVFDSKGTVERKAFINKKLKKMLLQYCREYNITSGIIFKARTGRPLNEAYIYKEIQWLAGQAKIKKDKAHPHSFRHLFAKRYISKPGHNLVDLKNLLGHKRLTTTEIYLQKSDKELAETLED